MRSPMDELRVMHRQIGGMALRGVVSATGDGAKMQTVQVRIAADEVTQDLEHFQPYGFTSQALAGAEAIVLAVGAQYEGRVAIAVSDRRSRPKVQAGESVLYDDQGQLVAIRRNGLVLDAAGRPDGIKLGASASLGVARKTDAVDAGVTMETWVAAVTTAVNGLVTGAVVQPTDFGTITGGSGTVTAAD